MTQIRKHGKNPFQPGAGLNPPYLAGRDGILADWRENLEWPGEFRQPEILMYGPRGTGKTAILGEFQQIAKERGCNVARASAPILKQGEEAMATKLLEMFEAVSHVATETTTTETQAGGGVPGVAQGRVAAGRSQTVEHRHPVAGLSLEARLEAVAQQKPLVVLLDEAHAVKGEPALSAMGALANAVQQLVSENKAPICLVLAGTPGVRQVLVDAQCSFASRFERYGIGLLDEAAAKDAIVKPLEQSVWREATPDSRLGIEPKALDEVVKGSQGYPFFLQLWGSHLWDQAKTRDADSLILADIEAVREAVDAKRLMQYQERGEEINYSNDLLVAASAIAESFKRYYAEGDARWIEQTAIINVVEAALTVRYPNLNDREAALKHCMHEFARLGFVWNPPGSLHMEPGIPSFLNYAQELHASRRGQPQTAS